MVNGAVAWAVVVFEMLSIRSISDGPLGSLLDGEETELAVTFPRVGLPFAILRAYTPWRLTGPVAYKPHIIYVHCTDEVKEFTVHSRNTLVGIVNFLVEKKNELSRMSDMALKPRPKKDDELLCILMGSKLSTCTRFQEAERAIDRDCLLDACTSLFSPFGLQLLSLGSPTDLQGPGRIYNNSSRRTGDF